MTQSITLVNEDSTGLSSTIYWEGISLSVAQISEIIEMMHQAQNNPTLQAALDECKMIYKLTKEYNNGL